MSGSDITNQRFTGIKVNNSDFVCRNNLTVDQLAAEGIQQSTTAFANEPLEERSAA